MWTSAHLKKRFLAGLGCLALLFTGGVRVRADHIDNELRTLSVKIMKDLEEHGYKNVGILKFQVKKGNTAPTLAAGKLNYLMATRLENALVMSDKADNPIGLTRGASAVAAAKDKKATYLTLEGRQKLLKHHYPLAFETRNVEIDAFLTGIVEIAPDMKKTKITVKAFDKNNPNFRDVLSFTVETDLAILRDTNQNFVVARRAFKAFANADDPDEELNKIAVKDAAKENQPGVSRKLSVEEMQQYLDFQILYDNQPVDVTPEGFLDKPTAGQTVLIKVTAKVKLGLLLRVNGMNTLNEQSDEKADLSEYGWWVLDPSTEYVIRGFYSNGQVKTFLAKAQADVDVAAELGENAERHGKIDFDVFVDPASVVQGAVEPKTRKANFSFRTVKTRTATFSELKTKVKNSMVAKKTPTKRTFIVGGAVENQTLETTTFDGRHVGGLTINYRRDLAGGKTGDGDSSGN
jgi:hypothetical protein